MKTYKISLEDKLVVVGGKSLTFEECGLTNERGPLTDKDDIEDALEERAGIEGEEISIIFE